MDARSPSPLVPSGELQLGLVSGGDPMAEGLDTSGRTAGPDSAYPVFSTPALICFTGPKGVDGMVGPPDLSESEAVGLNAGGGEGDLESAVGDGAGLADELVHPLLCDRAIAIPVRSEEHTSELQSR